MSLAQYLKTTYRTGLTSREAGKNYPRMLARIALTRAVSPLETRKAQRLAGAGQELKLHLGCAKVYLDHWVNIDLARPGQRQDLSWDLRQDLPFPDDSVTTIFIEHVLCLFDFPTGLQLLKECHRVLQDGGVLRLGDLDLERYVRSYLNDDAIIDEYRPGRPTRGMALGEIFFFHGRRAVYDYDTLDLLLHEAGFGDVERSSFKEGRLGSAVDSELRRMESMYIEARK